MTCLPPTIKTHPLYPLRRALLLTTILSFLFAILSACDASSYGSYHDKTPYIWHLILATLSALLNTYELARWGIAKFHAPDAQPTYPLKRVLAADVVLAVAFLIVFVAELVEASSRSCYSGSSGVAGSYASMASLATAVLHAACAWKQLMALKKKQWEQEIAGEGGIGSGGGCGHYRTRCPSCGVRGVWYRDGDGEVPYARDMPTPVSTGGLDLATGYEIIPDKMPEGHSTTGRKGKAASRLGSHTSLMEV